MDSLIHLFAVYWIVSAGIGLTKYANQLAHGQSMSTNLRVFAVIVVIGITIWAAWYLGLRL